MLRLMDVAALVVRDADALIEKYPNLQDGLADLIDWWDATFLGGKHRTKQDAPPAPSPAKPDGSSTTPAPANKGNVPAA
jgi:hypothetical protein